MKKIVIIKERSSGNESVGEMWLETMIFKPTDSLDFVLESISKKMFHDLGRNRDPTKNGKLIITIAEDSQEI